MEPDSKELERRFRPRLEAELIEVLAQIEGTQDDRKPVELDQQSVGRLSRMDAMQMQAMAQAVEGRLRRRRVMVEQALGRMEEDEFGFCTDCGEYIGDRRLEIDPAAPKCVRCA